MSSAYIRLPNSSTAPPPDGPIHLGHVLDDLTNLRPLNRKSRLEIPPEDLLPLHEQPGFEATRKSLRDGTYGIGARLLSILGAGADANGLHGSHWQETIKTECLRTIAFIPTDEYIERTLSLECVRSFLECSNYNSTLYMVTGLKVAMGASVQTSIGRRRGLGLDLALNIPGTPVEVGPKFEYTKTQEENQSFLGSTFVLAFQVEKIKVRRKDFSHKAHLKGAMYRLGDSSAEQGTELDFLRMLLTDEDLEVIRLDRQGGDIVVEEDTANNVPDEKPWVIPCKALGVTEDDL
ncbi:hypothetical protein VPNG_02823 [Cytospora leucostoma]|uniref:Uncharacterized protein n=1 Tax=Cytospora leucostoma TaxID=1230097 RepID=A0A423XJB5_9PEZI|nr:hypothetical protein VPNG_02823 [Cytospora leucostoma]